VELPGTVPPVGSSRGWRVLLDWLTFGLTGSGAAWLMAQNLFATTTDFGPLAPPWAARVLAIHGGVAMLFLIAVGAWLPLHVAPRLRRGAGLVSGIFQLGLLAALTITGYGLYYLAQETTRPTWSSVHWLCGLVLPTVLLFHRRRSRLPCSPLPQQEVP
jgi:hypothetical protein